MDYNIRELIHKAENQKVIKAEIVYNALSPFYKRHLELLDKSRSDLDHYNKHTQLMKSQMDKLKARNRELQKELNEAKLLNYEKNL